jgi:TPP-dependent trihydroxycyclohexane-1,2-dione (THcHDO) dehydratase
MTDGQLYIAGEWVPSAGRSTGSATCAALPAAMRVLVDPVNTGAAVLSLPQDIQSHAYDFPVEFFADREWSVRRPVPALDDTILTERRPTRSPVADVRTSVEYLRSLLLA